MIFEVFSALLQPRPRGCLVLTGALILPMVTQAFELMRYPGSGSWAHLPAPRPPALGYALTHSVDFEDLPIGVYDPWAIRKNWPGLEWVQAENGNCTISSSVEDRRNKVVMAVYPAGSFGSAAQACQWRSRSALAMNAGYLSYRVRFADGFQFVRGGKLPGLVGGAANTGRQRPNGFDGFSARLMWRKDGRVVHYVYHPRQRRPYGDDFPWDQGYTRYFVPGQWHRIEMFITINDPGLRNGVLMGWMDGELALHLTDMEFRRTDSFGVDGFIFSTFFGGADAGWAPSRTQFIDFDDFILNGYE